MPPVEFETAYYRQREESAIRGAAILEKAPAGTRLRQFCRLSETGLRVFDELSRESSRHNFCNCAVMLVTLALEIVKHLQPLNSARSSPGLRRYAGSIGTKYGSSSTISTIAITCP